MKSREKIKELTILATFAAMAYILTFFQIPVMFLSYETKDVIIAISGFLFGPVPAVLTSLTVSLLEMVTISDTAIWGALMNFVSTCAFVVPAACIYKRWHSMKGAITGLLFGIVSAVVMTTLWNYFIVPLYAPHITKDDVLKMLPTLFIPFNLIKTLVNSALIMIIYKPLTNILRKARLLPPSAADSKSSNVKSTIIIYIVAAVVIVAGLLLFKLIKP